MCRSVLPTVKYSQPLDETTIASRETGSRHGPENDDLQVLVSEA